MQKARVILADGTVYDGEALGATGETIGEVVFNTSMSGYQEILTDPSYRGQLVTMTAPHIGNYGVNTLDVESDRVQVAGFIVREASRRASNYRATASLQEWLIENGIVAITGVDTRSLTRRIRDAGAIMGAIVHGEACEDVDAVVARIAAAPGYGERDYIAACSVTAPRRVWLEPTGDTYQPWRVVMHDVETPWPDDLRDAPEVSVLDFGVKYSILRNLVLTGLRVTLWPHDTAAETIKSTSPAGVMLSNGPGDPGTMDDAVDRVRDLLGAQPVFGICLGHQLLARAVGGETFKLKFGHRGPNQPVRDADTGRIEITAQNHGYAVTLDAPTAPVEVTHVNLNDGTVEGLRVPSLRAFSVQHHPEAGPGPHDAAPVFHTFRRAIADA